MHATLLKGRLRKSTTAAAGYDLFATEDVTIPVGKRASIPTGVVVTMPNGMYGQIQDRSGLAAKNGLTTLAGTIDADYPGEIKVILLNTGDSPAYIKQGDRCGQIVFMEHLAIYTKFTDEFPSFDENSTAYIEYGEERTGGFGSTGQ
jgi:dUTP pyrophosphatase